MVLQMIDQITKKDCFCIPLFIIKKENKWNTNKRRVRDVWYLQHFANVASAKNLVNYGELLGFIRRKIRSKGAIFCASASQKLA